MREGLPIERDELPALVTDRLRLREPVAGDAASLFVFRSDPEVQKYNSDPMVEVSEALELIAEVKAEWPAQTGACWVITFPNEDVALGLVGFHDWNRRHRRVAIGYDMARAYWGQGIATEAIAAMLRFGFEYMHLNRIEATTLVVNTRSTTMLERLGFRLEGVRREYVLEDDGKYYDSALYALLRQEYRG